jgi:aminoglycoside phosphotransferase (APT) family kinase protein
MTQQIRTLLARHLPGYEVWSVTEAGEGLDNAAREVNGELIVRTSKESDPALRAKYTRREADLLTAVTGISTLPVPEPVFVDLDWTDAAIADPARDLALIYRDLGPEACRLVPAHYEGSFGDADRERAVFYARCKLIEDLAYGLGTPGARRYAEVGLSHLARSFEPFA